MRVIDRQFNNVSLLLHPEMLIFRTDRIFLRTRRKNLAMASHICLRQYNIPDKRKEKKISSYIMKFRRDQLQSHIWLTAPSYFLVKYLHISSYIRNPFLIYDFVRDPIWISFYMRKILFFFFINVLACLYLFFMEKIPRLAIFFLRCWLCSPPLCSGTVGTASCWLLGIFFRQWSAGTVTPVRLNF